MWQALIRTNNDPSLTVLRVTLGAVMFAHGAQSVLGWFGGPGLRGAIASFGELGVPAAVAVLVVSAELFGSLGLMAGLLTRLAAAGIVAVMAGAIAVVHWPYGFFMNWFGQQSGEGFEYHLLVIAMALAVVARGGGWASLDSRLARWLGEQGTRADVPQHVLP
ncbi:MAG: DoxX family protein [Vicinamibacteraceae bacterium]